MKNTPAQIIGFMVFGLFMTLLISFGVYTFKINQFPRYQETVDRQIQTTGGLQDSTITELNNKLGANITVNRASYNGSSWQPDTSSTNNRVQPYGTKVDYVITYKPFTLGFINFTGVKNAHSYAITQTRGASDIDIPTQQGNFPDGGSKTMTPSNSGNVWGGLAYNFGRSTGADVTIGHNQGLYQSFQVTPSSDVRSNVDINNWKEGAQSNDNDNIGRRDYYVADANGKPLSSDLTHYTLKAGQTYTIIVKYYNDNSDLQPIHNDNSGFIVYNTDGSRPSSVTMQFSNFNWAVIDNNGKPAKPNGANLLSNPSGQNASKDNRPSLDNQPTGVAWSNTDYLQDGIQLTYTGDGSQETYYAISEYAGNNLNNFSSIKRGDTYTMSVDVKGTMPQAVIRMNGGVNGSGQYGNFTNINSNYWTRIYVTFTIQQNAQQFWLRVNGASNGSPTNSGMKNGQTMELKNFKLEEGSTATP